MPKPGKSGFARIIDATGYSFAGLKAAYQHEAAFRQELLFCAVLIPVGYWLGDSTAEKAILILVSLLLPMAELVNSAIEAVVDRISDEHHPLAGRAKDIGSAVVFVSILNIVIVWTVVLVGR
ncbi:MAG: diacylglycerol kinase [Gammaproteobacteria bacterium]